MTFFVLTIIAIALVGLLLIALRPTVRFKYEVARDVDNFISALPKLIAIFAGLFVILIGITILADRIDRVIGIGAAGEEARATASAPFPVNSQQRQPPVSDQQWCVEHRHLSPEECLYLVRHGPLPEEPAADVGNAAPSSAPIIPKRERSLNQQEPL